MASQVRPLIEGKFARPRSPRKVVDRPRLFDELDLAVDGQVALVTAPAGWGKTVLLSSWADQRAARERPMAWLTVSSTENDAVPFWNYVLASMRTVVSQDECPTLFSLSPPHSTGADFQVFVALLVNALGDLASPVVLLIDDVHEIWSRNVLEQFSFLVQHAPTQLHFVLAGRFLPPLTLTRLRASDQVHEVSPSTLAFTTDEVSRLMDSAGLTLDSHVLTSLHQITQGWAAGLQLAALSARGHHEPEGQLARFGGDQRLVADYLLSEVFLVQTQQVQQFLLRISICASLSADLAQRLTGERESQTILSDLESRNLFVSAASSDHSWFRLHPIFAAFLRHRLASTKSPGFVAELHQAASDWYERSQHLREAFDHATAADDWAHARALFSQLWLELYLSGEDTALTEVIESFPIGSDRTGQLFAVRALVYLADGDRINADAAAALARERFGEPEHATGADDIPLLIFDLHRARIDGDLKSARHAAAELLRVRPSGSTTNEQSLHALILLHVGAAELWAANRKEANERLLEALSIARRTGQDNIVLGCLSQLAAVISGQDRPTEACAIARDALELAEHRGWTHTAEAAMAWHILGWSHYLWGNLDEADRYLDRAEDSARRGGTAGRATIRCDQGLVLALRGDPGAALIALQEAQALPEGVRNPIAFEPLILSERVRLMCTVGQQDQAAMLLASAAPARPWPVQLILAQAQMQMESGDPEAAIRTLQPAVSGAAEGFLEERIQAVLMSAVAHARSGLAERAHDQISRAVELGRKESLIQPFMRVNGQVAALLEHVEPRPETIDYLTRLRAALGPLATAAQGLSSPRSDLSAREIEVLRQLTSLLTVPEIAAELYISVNTVKAHLKSIYRKLDAPNRRSAVKAARAIGLL